MTFNGKKFSIVLAITFFTLYFLVWVLSPFIAPHFVQKQLSPFGLVLSETSHIRYNPFISELRLETFEINHNNQTVLAIEQFKLSTNLHRLIFKQLDVNELVVKGLYLKVNIEEENTIIMGIPLPKNTQQEAKKTPEKSPYQLLADLIVFHDLKVDMLVNGKALLLDTALFQLNTLSASQQQQSAQLALKTSLEQSSFNLDAELAFTDESGVIDSHLSVEQSKFSLLKSYLQLSDEQFNALINFNGKQKISIDQQQLTIELTDNTLSIDDLIVANEQASAKITKQEIIIPTLVAQYSLESTISSLKVQGNGQFSLDNILLSSTKENKTLVNIQQISAPSFTIDNSNDIPTVLFKEIDIAQIHLGQADKKPALAHFQQINTKNITLNALKADISSIVIRNFTSDIIIENQGYIVSLESFESLEHSAEASEQSSTNATTPIEEKTNTPYQFKLDSLQFEGDNTIHFVDQSVSPIYERNINIETFSIVGLDSKVADSTTTVLLKGKSNEYAQFDLQAKAKHFIELPEYNLKGTITEVSLPAVSSYLKDSISYEIDSGQLNLNIETTLTGEEIDGDVGLLLSGFNFSSTEQADEHQDINIVSFAAALDMLKDGDGNVDLNVPLSGNVNDPDFGTTGFMALVVKKAAMMAAKDYLVTAFVPYGNVLSLVEAAGKQLLKIRFNDLPYQIEQIETNESQREYIALLSTLLTDKDDVNITLCAVSIPADIGKMGEVTSETLNSDAIEQLHTVSNKRMKYLKKHLVENYNIASSRLLLCTPKIDYQDSAIPRITFNRNNN